MIMHGIVWDAVCCSGSHVFPGRLPRVGFILVLRFFVLSFVYSEYFGTPWPHLLGCALTRIHGAFCAYLV